MRILIAFILTATTAPAAADLEIFYTGRLLGHARIPDQQWTTTRSCEPQPDKPCPPSSKAAQVLLRFLQDTGYRRKPGQLLLGLGDNFGPEYWARSILEAETGSQAFIRKTVETTVGLRPVNPKFKDYFVWMESAGWFDIRLNKNKPLSAAYSPLELAGRATIPFDNVAEFFRKAGYQAIVPGKHDFYFGAERLRQLEKLLRSQPNGPALLGANLRIHTTRVNPPATVPDRFKDLGYVSSHRSLSISLPKIVYPWARRFRVGGLVSFQEGTRTVLPENLAKWRVQSVDKEKGEVTLGWASAVPRTIQWKQEPYQVQLCSARPDNPELIDLKGCRTLPDQDLTPAGGQALTASTTFDFGETLAARQNYAICLQAATTPSPKPYCQSFTVSQPFWTYGYPSGEEPAPYYVNKETKVVVFGLLDPALQASLPAANAGWINSDEELETITQITDPKEALDQAIEACVAAGDCGPGTQKILLAQMPEEHAAALARRAGDGFLAVIGEANLRQPTPTQTLVRDQNDHRPLILSPGPIYQPGNPDKAQVFLQKLSVEKMEGGARKFGHQVFMEAVDYPPQDGSLAVERRLLTNEAKGKKEKTLGELSLKALYGFGLKEEQLSSWSAATVVERAILHTMRETKGADIAFLQKRDLFRVPDVAEREVKAGRLAEVLDRLLWKGDFLVKVHVKGSVLEAVMARSKELADLDMDSNKVETEEGRSLLRLGIDQDPDSKAWFVNGAQLDKARIYQVALPDYLAYGDTTYPQFKGADGLAKPRIRDESDLGLISMAFCIQVSVQENCTDNETGIDLTAKNLLDNIAIPAPDGGRHSSIPAQLAAGATALALPVSPFRSSHELERKTQGRRVYSITFEKLEGSFSKYSQDAPGEKGRSDLFSGLNGPQVVLAPESASVNTASRVRARMSGARGDLFVLGEETLSRVQTRETSGSEQYLTDLKQNIWSLESGYYWRAFRTGAHRPEWLVLASARHEHNVVNPITTFKFQNTSLRGELARAHSTAGRLGLRWEKGDTNNWLELGYQGGIRAALPDEIAFTGPGSQFHCNANQVGTNTFAQCVTANTAGITSSTGWGFAPNYISRPRVGPFLRFRLELPILGHREYTVVTENTGEFFHNLSGDVATDTRWYNDWSIALRFKWWDNLGFGPKYQMTFFQNKVQGSTITGHTTSFNVEYRFDWRPGIPLNKALRVPYPPK
jgi:hypothetical protein